MAFGDCFPADLVNATDFTVTRPGISEEWGDDEGTPTAVAGPLEAVVEEKTDLIRTVEGEEVSLLANVYLRADAPNVGNIRHRDRAAWTMTPGGSFADEEILVVERVSGVDGLEHVRLRLGRRIA